MVCNMFYLSLILLAFVTLGKIYFDTNFYKINRIVFQTDKLPIGSEVIILQISDLHNKVFGNNNKQLIRTIKLLKADTIVITGDLIDRRTKNLNNVFHFVKEITSFHNQVFFVTGNHEWANPLFEELLSGLRTRHVKILDHMSTQINVGESSIQMVGVDDYSISRGSINKALPITNNDQYTILLSHSPGVIQTKLVEDVDLILSGHTHGGQFRLPLIGALVVPDQGFFPKYDKGMYKIGDNKHLYIDSGLGTSRLPIRFLNQSQISMITITNKKGATD